MRINDITIRVAVAETSVILRSGIIAVLKRQSYFKVIPMEIVSVESLVNCLQMHSLDIVLVNPSFSDNFDVEIFRKQAPDAKFIAFLSCLTDSLTLKKYDAHISIYDGVETIGGVIEQLIAVNAKDKATSVETQGQDILSQREKEIVVCVVKGMMNKEIAEKLFLSIHTVITHRRNITRKLQIHSSAALAIYAIVNNLVDIKEVKQH